MTVSQPAGAEGCSLNVVNEVSGTADVRLREVRASDLLRFYAHQLDPWANHMVAFTARDPVDRDAFDRLWFRILADYAIVIRTMLAGWDVAGNLLI